MDMYGEDTLGQLDSVIRSGYVHSGETFPLMFGVYDKDKTFYSFKLKDVLMFKFLVKDGRCYVRVHFYEEGNITVIELTPEVYDNFHHEVLSYSFNKPKMYVTNP